ncbi:MAG: hypothetical protein A2Y24_07570 [Clostridiales bacterium GWE2_32_10]|nr:MAG: hypothetical protein A2Y24_07570 [Clostridiales bacterium GWE2_32_10]HBY20566.1 hypothetical protein [Clostridiales bacterium]
MSDYGVDKELSEFETAVCRNQALLFQECQWDFDVDSKDFIAKFMNGNIAASMDKQLSPFHNTGIKQIGEAMLDEYEIDRFNGNEHNQEVLYWMGYIYRYWNMWLGESSKEIYEIADYDYMSTVYNYFHTLSPETAIMRIKNKK